MNNYHLEQKNQVRTAMKETFLHYKDAPYLQEKTLAAQKHLFGSALYKRAHCLFLFLSTKSEISTYGILSQAQKDCKGIAIPQVCNTDLIFRMLDNTRPLKSQTAQGVFGIVEPQKVLPVIAPDLQSLFLVPGRAFDTSGNRVGYGKGFYDRYFSDCAKNHILPTVRVGLCYDFQIVSQLPHETHDVCMTHLLSNSGLLAIGHTDTQNETTKSV